MALLIAPVLVHERVAHDAVLLEARVQVERDVVARVDVGADLEVDGAPAVPVGLGEGQCGMRTGGGGGSRSAMD